MGTSINKYLKIENPRPSKDGAPRWHIVPKGERAELWNMGTALVADTDPGDAVTRHIFQIAHIPNVSRASRVTFMGQHFKIVHVSQASALHGMELQCEAIR